MNITLNPDGYSIKGCSIIYHPAGQAGEYAPLATNPYRGCGHGCVYCYVPAAIRMSRTDFDAGAKPRDKFLERLTKEARKYQAAGMDCTCGQIRDRRVSDQGGILYFDKSALV